MNHDRRVKRVGNGWGFVVRVGGRGGKQYRRQGFPTARAANDALRELLDDADAGVPVSRRGQALTVGEYLTERWVPSLPGRVRPSTEESYRRIVRLHLVPNLGSIALGKLDAAHIEAMLAQMTNAGRSAKTRANVRGVLSVAMKDARRWKLTTANPVPDSANPRPEPPQPRAWDIGQLTVFLDATAGDRLGAAWRLLALTGMRRGELLGLQWPDIDLDAAKLTIVRQRTPVGGRVVEGQPKTRSGRRTLTIDEQTVRALRAWRKAQTEELVRLGIRPNPLYVVTNESGRPHDPNHFTARFRSICRGQDRCECGHSRGEHDRGKCVAGCRCARLKVAEAVLPVIGPHGLRHTAATYWIGQGVNPKAVSQRLGHADVSVTLRVYSHAMPGDDQRAADMLAAALETPKAKRGVTNV